MYLFWYQLSKSVNNFGDELNPYIIAKLTGKKVRHLLIPDSKYARVNRSFKLYSQKRISLRDFIFVLLSLRARKYYVAIGSVIEWIGGKDCHVWGAGLMNKNGIIKSANFHAVRGQVTKNRLIELGHNLPEAIGDPALLLPIIFRPNTKKKYELGVIPHYVHKAEILRKQSVHSNDILVIDVLSGVEDVINQINSCKKTISSSLHGIIVSHAYGIPSLWCELGIAPLSGDDIKFEDYFSSVDIRPYKKLHLNLDNDNLLDQAKNIFADHKIQSLIVNDINEIQKQLILSSPFKILEKFKKKLTGFEYIKTCKEESDPLSNFDANKVGDSICEGTGKLTGSNEQTNKIQFKSTYPMEQQVIDIAKIIQQNGLTGANHGLMYGNTGLCIFFYHLARKTNNPEYEKIADDLLDKVFASLSTSAPADFDNGLAGIGWGVEHLVQNNFAEGNPDEILEEVDNKVFRALNEETHQSIELGNGLTGYLFYLINRLKRKEEPFSMAHRINRELLILTINKIDELATLQFPTIVKDIYFDLFWRFPVMLYGLTEAFKLNIYNEKISCMIRQWLPYFEAYIPSLHINRIFMAVVLKQICVLMPDKRLEKQVQILLFATDFELLKTEVDHRVFNIRYGWPGVVWLLNLALKEIPDDWPNHELIGQTVHEITGRHKDPLENLPLNSPEGNSVQSGLTLGIAGIGLMELLWSGVLLPCHCSAETF